MGGVIWVEPRVVVEGRSMIGVTVTIQPIGIVIRWIFQ